MRIAIISCSLNPTSRSRQLALFAQKHLTILGSEVDYLDMREFPLPAFADAASCDTPVVTDLVQRLARCTSIVVAVPIYNWSTGSVLKALMETTGNLDTGAKVHAWENKVLTFLCSGGLHHSYMAWGSTALGMMMDFKSIINPHVLYARERQITEDGVLEEKLQQRAEQVLSIHHELAEKLQDRKILTGWCV